MNPDIPPLPELVDPPRSADELRRRVSEIENELQDTLGALGDVAGHALDWKSVVNDHPVETILGAAAIGFMAAYQPKLLAKPGARLAANAVEAGSDLLMRTVMEGFSAIRNARDS
jgi:hypothetical protein